MVPPGLETLLKAWYPLQPIALLLSNGVISKKSSYGGGFQASSPPSSLEASTDAITAPLRSAIDAAQAGSAQAETAVIDEAKQLLENLSTIMATKRLQDAMKTAKEQVEESNTNSSSDRQGYDVSS